MISNQENEEGSNTQVIKGNGGGIQTSQPAPTDDIDEKNINDAIRKEKGSFFTTQQGFYYSSDTTGSFSSVIFEASTSAMNNRESSGWFFFNLPRNWTTTQILHGSSETPLQIHIGSSSGQIDPKSYNAYPCTQSTLYLSNADEFCYSSGRQGYYFAFIDDTSELVKAGSSFDVWIPGQWVTPLTGTNAGAMIYGFLEAPLDIEANEMGQLRKLLAQNASNEKGPMTHDMCIEMLNDETFKDSFKHGKDTKKNMVTPLIRESSALCANENDGSTIWLYENGTQFSNQTHVNRTQFTTTFCNLAVREFDVCYAHTFKDRNEFVSTAEKMCTQKGACNASNVAQCKNMLGKEAFPCWVNAVQGGEIFKGNVTLYIDSHPAGDAMVNVSSTVDDASVKMKTCFGSINFVEHGGIGPLPGPASANGMNVKSTVNANISVTTIWAQLEHMANYVVTIESDDVPVRMSQGSVERVWQSDKPDKDNLDTSGFPKTTGMVGIMVYLLASILAFLPIRMFGWKFRSSSIWQDIVSLLVLTEFVLSLLLNILW